MLIVSNTIDFLSPETLLKNVDLPTFGLPTTATSGLAIKNHPPAYEHKNQNHHFRQFELLCPILF